jgi:phosphatidate cytidylyltransferase
MLADGCAATTSSVDQQVALLFVVLFGVLLLLSLALLVRTLRDDGTAQETTCATAAARPARAVGRRGGVLGWPGCRARGRDAAFGVFSFLALREFITLVHTRRGDHRSLLLAFFVVLPLQYLLVGCEASTCSRCSSRSMCSWPSRWSARWPATRALPGAQRQDPVGHHGLRLRPEPRAGAAAAGLPRFAGRGAFLLFFLVMVVVAAQIAQELASRWLRRGRWCARSTAASPGAPGGAGRAGAGAGGRGAVLDHAVGALARRWPWPPWPVAAARWATW